MKNEVISLSNIAKTLGVPNKEAMTVIRESLAKHFFMMNLVIKDNKEITKEYRKIIIMDDIKNLAITIPAIKKFYKMNAGELLTHLIMCDRNLNGELWQLILSVNAKNNVLT